MSIPAIHKSGSIVFNSVSSGFSLHGVNNINVDPKIEELMATAGGAVDPSYVAHGTSRPMITATVNELSVMLGGGLDHDGLAIGSAETITSCDVYQTKSANRGSNASGSTHHKARIANGIAYVNSITIPHGQIATAEISIHGVSTNGTLVPLTTTDSVALPSGAGAITDGLYTLGPVSINGSLLEGVTSVRFNCGVEVKTFGSDGDLYDTYVTIMTRNPRLELTLKDITVLNDFGIGGTAQSGTATNIYLQKISKMGSRVAAATTEHIRLRVNASQGMHLPGAFSGGNDGMEANLLMIPIQGSTDMITIATGVAIA